MSSRPNRRQNGNQIRGPHSALTDFLASHNISAAQIQNDYQERLRQAERQTERQQRESEEADEQYEEGNVSETLEEKKKRKRKESAMLAKIKQSKEFARRKAQKDSDSADDGEIAREMMYQKSKPLPGQLENCEICEKRFTVTPYSKTGPNGGLLCAKCSKELGKDQKKATPKKAAPKTGRRQNQSKLLDGIAQQGASSLVEMCVKKVADNINDVEEFGDLPPLLLHRLSQILSKRRVLTPRTLQLFLRSDFDSINIYDCGKLETDDYQKIFTFMPHLVHVNLRFAGQMKDSVVEYMMDRELKIKHLQLDAANLVSDACWQQLFIKLGPQLEGLKLSNLDSSFEDETVVTLSQACPNLRRLKFSYCWKLGDEALEAIGNMSKLEHLSLNLLRDTQPSSLIGIIDKLGPSLRTLSLQGFHDCGDEVLQKLHTRCSRLEKLRFAENAVCTDQGFKNLFTGWSNLPLKFVDLSSSRDLDNPTVDGSMNVVGFASDGFTALMRHSGSKLEKLNISSCRHISRAAFEEVFADDRIYPALQELDISFQTVMDDIVVTSIFNSCPALKKLIAFACFNVTDVRVPAGVALIGGLRAQDSIWVEGTS